VLHLCAAAFAQIEIEEVFAEVEALGKGGTASR